MVCIFYPHLIVVVFLLLHWLWCLWFINWVVLLKSMMFFEFWLFMSVCLNNFVNWSFCDAICLKNQAACLELGMSNRPVAGDFTISSLSWFLLVERWGWQTPSFLEKYIITKISRCNFRRNLTEQSFKNQEVSFVFT